MTSILAQSTDLPGVPAEILKWVIIILVSIVLITCAIIGAWAARREPKSVRIADDPAPEVRKAPKRYNHDATELRFTNLEQRVTNHDQEIQALRNIQAIDLPAMERRLDDASETRVEKVHVRVNDVLKGVSELTGEVRSALNRLKK